ncbi:4,5-DOPA dioxygenase extradiol [Arenimonas sp.]|uniref:4,5-DOPA-extradiol-dioxygenase n=1 Tax=Arenimonas sp. TaxID=1872635 RepID=UPI0039E4529A
MADRKLPVLFLGHGSPMNAIEDNAWRRSWQALGKRLPRPRAILCISAHWETEGPRLTSSPQPDTIHDFYGFPKPLFDMRYPAPGSPSLAQRAQALLGQQASLDEHRGLDHGAWAVLEPMYPAADIPVVQLGLDTRQPGEWHYRLATKLAPLRDEGVLIVGSGNIVHNLRVFRFQDAKPYDWAQRFDEAVAQRIRERAHQDLRDYSRLGADASLSIPTPEHYLPLLYALALQEPGETAAFFNEEVQSSISMRSVLIGA